MKTSFSARWYNRGMTPWGIYVHIPWCRSRCPYCAFNTYVDPDPPFEAYTQALLRQWSAHRGDFEGPPSTVFFGGGTPSLHPPDQIAALIEAFAPSEEAEITLEANPGTVNPALLASFRRAGVNRVSLGIQTFQRKHARFLNRGHSVDDAQRLLAEVAEAGFKSWSADLIFALPHQTLHEFEADLSMLLACEPPHVSLYGLTAEEGTPYTEALNAGRFPQQDEGLWEEMYDLAIARLDAEGLARYEVSNLARAGHRSAHNSLYWRGNHWLGLGAGAHGWHPQGLRTVGHALPKNFMAEPEIWAESHCPNAQEQALELLLSSLRHIDGVDLAVLGGLGWALDPEKTRRHIESGLLAQEENSIRVRDRGWKLINSLLLALESALVPLSEATHPD
jgi:oxygen-independent coproporphyrinogen-3 oxidase